MMPGDDKMVQHIIPINKAELKEILKLGSNMHPRNHV